MALPRINMEDLEPIHYETMKEQVTELSVLTNIYEYLSNSMMALTAIVVFFGVLILILLFKIKNNKNNFQWGMADSWIENKTLIVEVYMTEEQIGYLVKHYMIKTRGEPLTVVFPEYDRGELNE